MEEAHVQLARGHFCPSLIRFSPNKFSLHIGENFLVGSGVPHHYFPLSPSQPNTLQKVSSHFLSKVFNPPYFTYKQIHP